MKTIAFATSSKTPGYQHSDSLLAAELQKKGYKVSPVAWDSQMNWGNFDLVIIRSTWNYHEKSDNFLSWLDELKKQAIAVLNSIEIMKWNVNKRYLLELTERGFQVIPTRLIPKNSTVTLKMLLADTGWRSLVVKPTIGADAANIFLVSSNPTESLESQFTQMTNRMDVLIQEYQTSIQISGELSLIFFNKIYSHSVLKMPKANDFRTNEIFGSSVRSKQVQKSVIDQAQSIVSMFPDPLLYARIDAIETNGILMIMEVELIEPHLYFEKEKNSTSRFIEALESNASLYKS